MTMATKKTLRIVGLRYSDRRGPLREAAVPRIFAATEKNQLTSQSMGRSAIHIVNLNSYSELYDFGQGTAKAKNVEIAS